MNKVTRNTCTKLGGAALIAILALSMAPSVSAQEWDHTIVLSGFGTSLTGDAVFTQGQPEEDEEVDNPLPVPNIDIPFDYVLDNREFAGTIEYRASKDNLIIGGQLMLIGISDTKDQPPASAKLDMFVLQVDVGHRFSAIWDAYVGLRYASIEAKGSFEQIEGLRDPDFTSTDTYFDPVVGIRALVPFGERWQLQAQGDIGGGFTMDTTWQAMASVGLHASKAVSVWVGYRALSVDMIEAGANHNLRLDVVAHGPTVGVGAQF